MEVVFLLHMSQDSPLHEGVAVQSSLLPVWHDPLLHQPVHQLSPSEDGLEGPEVESKVEKWWWV